MHFQLRGLLCSEIAISTVWPLVSYLNSMVCCLPVSVSQIVDYCCVRSAGSWSGLFSFNSKALYAAARFCRWVSGPAPCCFFSQCGILHCHLLPTKDKLIDISVDCVVSMPYRSVRKKKERNRKYYACNSEQLKARGVSLYEEDPGKKKAAAQAYYNAHRVERKASLSSYYDAHKEKRKASFSSYYDAHRKERRHIMARDRNVATTNFDPKP